MNWFHRERRRHLASVFNAVALGELAVIGFNGLQDGVYAGFGEALVVFILLEFLALAMTPRGNDDEPDDYATYARRRVPPAG
jgi:hypothetical protein